MAVNSPDCLQVYGINYINSKTCDHEEVCDPIRAFKAESGVDIMVVSVHWGSMWASGNPAVNIQALFRAMADAGVNVVHGHGSHNLRVRPPPLVFVKHVSCISGLVCAVAGLVLW